MTGDGERIAVASRAELEFALEVHTPEVVGRKAGRELCALRARAAASERLDEAV